MLRRPGFAFMRLLSFCAAVLGVVIILACLAAVAAVEADVRCFEGRHVYAAGQTLAEAEIIADARAQRDLNHILDEEIPNAARSVEHSLERINMAVDKCVKETVSRFNG